MELNNEVIEATLKVYNKKEKYPLSKEDFIDNCLRYIKAIKEGRMMCSICSVSSSGMSRTMKFVEMAKSIDDQHYILNFYRLFCALQYIQVKDSDYFRIHGCGMDMVFHTNYTIIHDMKRMGFIDDKECSTLAQRTPHVI